MTEVSGKTLLVTGAGSGIGQGIARAFARAGARVAVADIDLPRAQETAREVVGPAVALDVGDHAAWPGAIAAVETELGPIDVLCNNAGVGGGYVPLLEIDEGWMRRLFEINLFGPITGMKLLGPGMRERGGGHIVNVASIGAVIATNQAEYAASKAALAMMSECFMHEMRGTGVGVTVVCPGKVATRLKETTEAVMGAKRMPSTLATPKVTLTGDQVGMMVLEAVRANRLWCFTHQENRQRVEQRWQAMSDAFAAIPPV